MTCSRRDRSAVREGTRRGAGSPSLCQNTAFGLRCRVCLGLADRESPVTVRLQTFDTLRDASAAVARESSTRFLGGGTLLVRALNEDAADFSTLVRCTDRALTEIRAAGSRVRVGARVTMAGILANPELAFLHPPARWKAGGWSVPRSRPPPRSLPTAARLPPTPSRPRGIAGKSCPCTVLRSSGVGTRWFRTITILRSTACSAGRCTMSRCRARCGLRCWAGRRGRSRIRPGSISGVASGARRANPALALPSRSVETGQLVEVDPPKLFGGVSDVVCGREDQLRMRDGDADEALHPIEVRRPELPESR